MQHATPVHAALRRDRVVVLAGLGAAAALAWTYMAHLAAGMGGVAEGMAMPQTRSWGSADLSLTFVMWAVMMIAMMVPTAAPVIVLFANVNRRRRAQEQPFVPTSVFVLGYSIIWMGFASIATVAQWTLHESSLASSTMGGVSPALGGLILVAAGAYQWTRWKDVCLQHCRTPFGFLMSEWRDGSRGALVMGLRHGTFCLACCWALMGLMFVGGVMNLLWMAGIASYVLIEKAAPAGHWMSRIGGSVLVAWGLWTLAQPLGFI